MSRNLLVALALAVLSLAVAAPAHAILITVNFTVTGAANDPVNNGVTANGSFSFDSSIIPATLPGSVVLPATSGFNLTWDGIVWTDANTTTGYPVLPGLVFGADGKVTNWFVYGDPNFQVVNNETDDFWVRPADFVYARSSSLNTFFGTTTWYSSDGGGSPPGTVPEPGTLALFAPGLLALGLVRRRKS